MTPNDPLLQRVASEMNLRIGQVEAVARLLAEGATVPFIARYRKEATGSLDEVAIAAIRDRIDQLTELEKRRDAILKSLAERDLLAPDLKRRILAAESLTVLEDLFAPHRPKRRTRAIIAQDRGLAPLADFVLAHPGGGECEEAEKFLGEEVPSVEEALAGARDIIAEKVSDHTEVRAAVRQVYAADSQVTTKVVAKRKDDPEAARFRDYFDCSEPLDRIPSHRLLAMRRGEKEGFLRLHVAIPEAQGIQAAERQFLDGPAHTLVRDAVEDGCQRLLFPSMETEMRNASRQRADEEAVAVFAANLRELLLASPLGQKRVLAIDPGFRTGCKTVCLDEQGKLLHHDVIYITGSSRQQAEAAEAIPALLRKFRIEAIAIGNGTGSRETETFVVGLGLPPSLAVVMVNESGASIYSASEVARREFPDHDVTVRGAVSIGRRLMDPLAELVKIEPKSIGVGQYQHDVDQNLLKRSLDDCVESCVNAVGVEVNTASAELLSHVSGLNRTIAENIVAYRDEHGPFRSRSELKKVPRLGAKAYEQAAGFLRIHEAENPLDSSAVHPERYRLVERMARDAGCRVSDLLTSEERRRQIDLRRYVSEDVGLPTLQDILEELAKPGRDPRRQFEVVRFAEGVEKPSDLQPGMRLPGLVTNVTKFGAFVDVGVHQDGLVHISQLADCFVQDPNEVVKVNQKVMVTVLEVDLDRKRISLSMKARADAGTGDGDREPKAGSGNRSSSSPPPAKSKDRSPDRSAGKGGDDPEDWFSAAVKKGSR